MDKQDLAILIGLFGVAVTLMVGICALVLAALAL